jgi:hypothetical protein
MKCEYFYEKQIGVDPSKYWYHEMNDDSRQPQWKLERQKYGFDERETWDLDSVFLGWIYPRLKMFREVNNCHPAKMTEDEWNSILDEMIDGFECSLKDGYRTAEDSEISEKLQKSLKLFAEYFNGLWW